MIHSLTPIPYCPLPPDEHFEQALFRACGYTLASTLKSTSNDEIIWPRWYVTPTGITYPEHTFLRFFDDMKFRTLLRCLLSQPEWHQETLLQRLGGAFSKKQYAQYIAYCDEQGFLNRQGSKWCRGPQLQHISNLGHTFEWVVMENLRVHHQAVARSCVHLQELSVPGDLDVVALRNDCTMMIECKSSASTITKRHLQLFLQRATEFRPDIALLLIDTPAEDVLRTRFQYLRQELGRPECAPLIRQIQKNGIVYWVANNLFLANTTGGIHAALDATIRLGQALKDFTQFAAHTSSPTT